LVDGTRRIGAGQTWGIPFRKSSAAPRTRTGAAELAPAGLRQSSLVPGPGTRVKTLQIFRKGIPQACLQAAAAYHTNYATCCFLLSRRAAESRRPPTFTPRDPPDQVRHSLQSIRTRLGDSSAELRAQAEITQAGPGEPRLTGGPPLLPTILQISSD